MRDVLAWYLFLTLAGWLKLPLAYRVFAHLPGRGLAFLRPFGLLLWGFVFFLLASFRIVPNDLNGELAALLLVVGINLAALRGQTRPIKQWLRENIGFIVAIELLSFAAFGLLVLVRAADPGIYGTEKPMEMAFINAILKSPTLPPQDPWLSGYSISYYYFGYLMVAMLTRVTGAQPGAAFNLALAAWFSMTAVAVYGVVFALLVKAWNGRRKLAQGLAFLGPLFVLISSNLEGFLDGVHQSGSLPVGFWQWLNIQEMCGPASGTLAFNPALRPGGIWWWRASRVIHDFSVDQWAQAAAGKTCQVGREIIDEFPFFSFLLSDLHPHVLGMPFSLLAIGLALNLFFQPFEKDAQGTGVWAWIRAWMGNRPMPLRDLYVTNWLRQPFFWIAAIALGGLAFMNTWDFPIYVAMVCSVVFLRRYWSCGWGWRRIGEVIELGMVLGGFGIGLYFPFYLGFSSQAGGLLPSMVFFTRGTYFWIMFGGLLVPIFAWLFWLWRRHGSQKKLSNGLKLAVGAIGGLWLISFLIGTLGASLSSWGSQLGDGSPLGNTFVWLGGLFSQLQGASDQENLVLSALVARLKAPGTWITLFGLVTLIWGLLSSRKHSDLNDNLEASGSVVPESSADLFGLLLALVGAGLVLVPEFFYLRDQFGWRMNTIFKFYFQAWILWGTIAAFASARLWQALRSWKKGLFGVSWVVVLAMGLVYPYFGLEMKLSHFDWAQFQLDGTSYVERNYPDDMLAIRWLRSAPAGVIAEAVGGSYSDYARISTHTGMQAVLGWPGHESQWRGGTAEMGSRQSDIQRLYETKDWAVAERLIDLYNIRYIYIGGMERNTYQVNESKFQSHLKPVYQQGSVVIFEAASN
jgi:YYY domain-containing protein